ncbi:e3 ubiquitin ligase ARI10 [Fusarium sp. NRRL 52700]|nr:e3 ubiquitin ligase ARI10 [Fusarium sp. NRRL 52700]
MDAPQHFNDETSSEEVLSTIVVRSSYEDSNQRDHHHEKTPEQHLAEEPDTQDDTSDTQDSLDDEMDVDDEGSEYTSDMLDDLSDGESDFQPGEDSAKPDDQDNEMTVDSEVDENSEDMLNSLSDGSSDDDHDEEIAQQGRQPAAPEELTTQETAQTETQECVGCQEDVPVTTVKELACGDSYCHQCLISVFELSLSVPWHFPPMCCNEEIPPEDFEGLLSANDLQRYREKLVEQKMMDPTYCSNRQCLKFIQPKSTDDAGEPCYSDDEEQCPACDEITCTACKNKRHTGGCEKQADNDQALALAESKGWKRCSRCGQLIERTDGCNRITCLCGHEFCYDIDPALQQHHLDAPPQPAPAAPNANRPRLPPMLYNHDWQRLENPGLCGVCREEVQPYIFDGVKRNTPTNQSESVWIGSDDDIYMIDVKSVFDPDSAADSRRVLLNKIPQDTTLIQVAKAVCGSYTSTGHIVKGAATAEHINEQAKRSLQLFPELVSS